MNEFEKLGTNSLGTTHPCSAKASAALVWAVLVATLIFVGYVFLFTQSVSSWWFNPEWTTDDALQQTYPFHKVLEPALFADDPITTMMEQYLTPLHFAVMWIATYLTGDPVMAGHWVMLLQLALTLLFVCAAVQAACGGGLYGLIPGLMAATWMLHTRLIVQRMTGGLPRGWAAAVFAAFLFFAIKRNHLGVLATLFVGCLLHPPATLICAAAYGLLLLWDFLSDRSKSEYRLHLVRFIVLSPVFCLITWMVVRMPPEIGTMASLEVASQMPEFSTPDGRFPFYPLKPVRWEIATFGFQAFISRLYNPGDFLKQAMIPAVLVLCAFLAFVAIRKKQELFVRPVVCFVLATLFVYFLARLVAFKLYVPDRHLQFPLAVFFVVALTSAVWRFASLRVQRLGPRCGSRGAVLIPCAGLCVLAIFIALGSGMGLHGSANFNYSTTKKGLVFEWMREHTEPSALIAGEPSLIDGTMLFGKRKAYITTETAHPFYDGYYALIKPRIERTLRAHYARSLQELFEIMDPEGVDYFVFERRRFYPEALASVEYFEPFNALLRELGSRPHTEYAYRELPRAVDLDTFPPLVFRDDYAVVVDIKVLGRWLGAQ